LTPSQRITCHPEPQAKDLAVTEDCNILRSTLFRSGTQQSLLAAYLIPNKEMTIH
jgi:hypothetical protein